MKFSSASIEYEKRLIFLQTTTYLKKKKIATLSNFKKRHWLMKSLKTGPPEEKKSTVIR